MAIVRDFANARLGLFDPDGGHRGQIPLQTAAVVVGSPLVVDREDRIRLPVVRVDQDRGLVSDPLVARYDAAGAGADTVTVPYPEVEPGVVADAGPALRIERAAEPATVLPEEASAHHDPVADGMRGVNLSWSWNGPEIPESKPFFQRLIMGAPTPRPGVSAGRAVSSGTEGRPGVTTVAGCQARFEPGAGVSAAVVAIAVVLSGCGAGDGGTEADSPVDTSALPLVTPELDLRVGSVDDPDYSLTRFTDVEVDGSGRMFTLHTREQVVRVFSEDGALERTFGGTGDGPGEFQAPVEMGWVGDSLWVIDGTNRRFSLFDPLEGEFLTSFTVPYDSEPTAGGMMPARAEGLLPGGGVHGSSPGFAGPIYEAELTVRPVVLMGRDGAVTETIADVPYGSASLAIQVDGRGISFNQPFSDSPRYAFATPRDALVIADGRLAEDTDRATYTVSEVDLSGDTIFSVRLDPSPVAITDAEVDSVVTAYANALEGPFGLAAAEGRELVRASLFRPRVRPAVGDLMVGRTGEVWIRETTGLLGARWVVVDTEGEPRFAVEFTEVVEILLADEDLAWGRLEDDLGVPYLVRYRIERPD